MLSTYQSYLFYTSNPAQTQRTTAADPTVSRNRAYYLANIGKVTSVSSFVNNYQLFSYAMNAYGLQDMTYAKSFMTKVLTSDLSDPNSFVNKLSDSRYKAFAKAYNFSTTGSVTSTAAAQTSSQTSDTLSLYTASAGSVTTSANAEANYMKTAVAASSNVSQITGNSRLVSDLLQAYGLSPYTTKAALTQALESDPNDPTSYVNQAGQQPGLKKLVADFNAASDGTLTRQTSTQAADMASQYDANVGSVATARNAEASYMQAAVASSTNVTQITGNFRLYSDLLQAYGLNASTTKAAVTQALESNPNDPTSYVNQAGQQPGLKKLAADFNVASDGTVTSQTNTQSADMASRYVTTASGSALPSVERAYLQSTLPTLTSVSSLTSNARLLKDVLAAYGVDSSTSTATITAALESDTSDPQSAVNQVGEPSGLKQMAEDFNFDASGNATTQRVAQTSASMSAMASAYTAKAGTTTTGKAVAAAETTYVEGVINNAQSVSDIVNDPRVVAYIGKAFGVTSLTASTLRSVLTSDPNDLKGAAASRGTAYQSIAAAFDFTATGTIARPAAGAAQSRAAIAATNSAYLEQTVETNAGQQDQGTQLALYFARKAPTITNAYQILADPALLKVAQTILSIPSSSTTNIDLEAKQISNGIKLTDLTNPVKVNALVSRFAALYDLANPTTSQNNISVLFGGSSN